MKDFSNAFFLLFAIVAAIHYVAGFSTCSRATTRRRSINVQPSSATAPLIFTTQQRRRTNVLSSPSVSLNDNNEVLSPLPNFLGQPQQQQQYRDVVIVGGGLAGLSAALFYSQLDPSRHITILEREQAVQDQKSTSSSAVASFAAAGMLAPQSERLPRGEYLDLCLQSRRMFPDFCQLVERLAQDAGQEGAAYLWKDPNNQSTETNGMMPWSVGHVASGGFLAPALAGDSVATWAPPEDSGMATWLDATQVRELEPNLHPNVVGGWWFPEDTSVDARRLTCSLRAACIAAGVQLLSGPDYEITSLDLSDGFCRGLWLKNGRFIGTKQVLLANGAWMRNLLPVPIVAHKGQSLSLRPASASSSTAQQQPPLLRRVIFAQDSYICPKADGRIIIGATVEAGRYDAAVTPAGMLHILTHALQLVPALKDWSIDEMWAGLRPTTPDKWPILGKTKWDNLFLAGGYWRNGVLLAPKTGQLLATVMSGQSLSKQDAHLLQTFSWDRFTSPEGGINLAANTRYAASMHPVQSRSTGMGVAAAVGTELGSYSTARSAAEERRKDRSFYSNTSSGNDYNDAFERAAQMGRTDAKAYFIGGNKKTKNSETDNRSTDPEQLSTGEEENGLGSLQPFEGSADAFTVDSAESSATRDIQEAYKAIQANKAKRTMKLETPPKADDRPDLGKRIYHIDPETGEHRMVPPYTSPGDFLKMVEEEKRQQQLEKNGVVMTTSAAKASVAAANDKSKKIEKPPAFPIESVNGGSNPHDYHHDFDDNATNNEQSMFDGYQTIQEANARANRDEELELMREARRLNRLGQSEINEGDIGVRRE